MSTQPTYEDAKLILRLYDMRREAKLREAREWFAANFKFETLDDVMRECPPGSSMNAYMRMVTSYWEMAASFVARGVLNRELFFESGREILFVWARFEHLLPAIRESYGDPMAFSNMATVSKDCIAWMESRSPGAYDKFFARVSPHVKKQE